MPGNQKSFKGFIFVCLLGVAEHKHCPRNPTPEVRSCHLTWGSSPWMGQVGDKPKAAGAGFKPSLSSVQCSMGPIQETYHGPM